MSLRRAPGGAAEPDSPDLTVTDLVERAELEALIDVYAAIWPSPNGAPPVRLEVLRALVHAGAMVLGAWHRGALVGGAVGFVGLPGGGSGAAAGAARLHSHIVGVLPAAQGRSVGSRLKWHQRDWCLARGIAEMTWTFDPLVRRNTWLNLMKLRAAVSAYHLDFYGPMDDGVNTGLPTDRCVATWTLDSPRVTAAAASRPAAPTFTDLRARGAVVVLAPDGQDRPRPDRDGRTGGLRLARVPADVTALRHRDPDLALRWRLALRQVLLAARDDGLALTAVSDDGWYVLAADDEGSTG